MIQYDFKQYFFRKCKGCDLKLQDGVDGTYHSYFCEDLLKLRFRKILGDRQNLACIDQALRQSKRNSIYFKEIFNKSNITELQIPVFRIISKSEAKQNYKDGHCKKCLRKVDGEMIFIHHLICRTIIMDQIEENLKYDLEQEIGITQGQNLMIEVCRKGDFYLEQFNKFQKYIEIINNLMNKEQKQKKSGDQLDKTKKKSKTYSEI